MKEEDPNTIALDAGDTFSGSPNANIDKGESILKILNTVAFDAMLLGNHESYLGLERISYLTKNLNYRVLAGNVVTTSGERIWDPYTIITLENGLKVGIVTATCGGTDGLEYLDTITSLQSQVDEIKADTDIIVALTHLGVEEDSGSKLVANEVKGIDVIIDGHSHTELKEGLVVNGILIAQTGDSGKNIGITELTFAAGAVTSTSSHLISKNEMLTANAKEETLTEVEKLLSKVETYYKEVIGKTTVDLIGLKELIRTQETNVGNLYADAVRDATGADISLCGAGIISVVDIAAGDISRGDVQLISRVTSTYTVGEMQGEDILKILNNHVESYPAASGAFYQVSGISFMIDPEQELGKRIHSVKVGGQDMEPDEIYTVAFAAQETSDEYKNAVIIGEESPESDEILEAYITANSPISPVVEGRIQIGAVPE